MYLKILMDLTNYIIFTNIFKIVKRCRHTPTIFKYCFSFLLISCIVRTSHHTDLFVEVTNITKGNSVLAHFASTRCFPSQIHMSRLIQKEDVQIETFCCIFIRIRVNWSSIIVSGISGTTITMPDIAHVSICRATTRPPRPSSTAECLHLIARLRGEQASAASWEPRPPFEATEMD